MSTDFERLLIPLRRDITSFRHQFGELQRQFDTIRYDRFAHSNDPDKQAAYKTRVLRWYYQGVPRAKHDLLQRLVAFWTAVPSAVAVMAYYSEVNDEDTAREVEMWQREVCALVQAAAGMFTRMSSLKLLNPKWDGAWSYPLFTDEGCVLEIEPGSYRCRAWIDYLES